VPWSPELHRRCDRLADALDTVCAAFRPATAQPIPPQSPRRQRKPSLAALKRRAEKAGLQMTSVTMPDGTIIHFGEGEQQQGNELDEWIAKHARAT
jgi:predicted transcriptional regulator